MILRERVGRGEVEGGREGGRGGGGGAPIGVQLL